MWLLLSSSSWFWCWPWISKSFALTLFNWDVIKLFPLILIKFFPLWCDSLLIISTSSYSISSSSNTSQTLEPSRVNNASTYVLSSPVLIRLFENFPPSTKSIASIIIDFPAPVSPDSILNPSLKFIVISSINAKFLIFNWINISSHP